MKKSQLVTRWIRFEAVEPIATGLDGSIETFGRGAFRGHEVHRDALTQESVDRGQGRAGDDPVPGG